MIHVTLNPDGKGIVGLPGRTVPIAAATARDARERTIRILTEHAAATGQPLEVTAIDGGETVMMRVHSDGRVIVNATVANGMYQDDAGDWKPVHASQKHPSAPAPGSPPSDTTTAVPAHHEQPVPMPLPQVQTQPHSDDSQPESVHELADDLEDTRIQTREPQGPRAVLTFSTGDVATVTGSALIGRHPTAGDGERVDHLIALVDDSNSVSKTHCLVAWQNGALWILDRHSGNGTKVVRDDKTVSLDPSKAQTLNDGDQVQIGEQAFTIALTGAVNARD